MPPPPAPVVSRRSEHPNRGEFEWDLLMVYLTFISFFSTSLRKDHIHLRRLDSWAHPVGGEIVIITTIITTIIISSCWEAIYTMILHDPTAPPNVKHLYFSLHPDRGWCSFTWAPIKVLVNLGSEISTHTSSHIPKQKTWCLEAQSDLECDNLLL